MKYCKIPPHLIYKKTYKSKKKNRSLTIQTKKEMEITNDKRRKSESVFT